MSYDLRRLRLHGLIQRLPHSNTYHLTSEGIRVAVFYTKLQDRLLRPLLDADKLPAKIEIRRALAASVEQDLTTARAIAGNRHIVEEPSAAELAVLGCLAAGPSRREIGARLYISLNTVKTHIRELDRKLDATSRADAVARAEALGLLDRPESPG